jgi:hypothetical protein
MRAVRLVLAVLILSAAAFAQTPKDHCGFKPLTDMTGEDKYKGEDGGLYGGGRNEPPEAHAKAAKAALAKIEPVDDKIVLLSIGMSNTTQEFSLFKKLADKDPDKSPSLVIVDGAVAGQGALQWSTKGSKTWKDVDARLKGAGVTASQVQILWIKQAELRPNIYGAYPKHAEQLQTDVTLILNIAMARFPNLHVAYLSSRTYGGWATSDLNPEPFAYESGFAVRSLIQAQIAKKDPLLNYDKDAGEVKSPILLWGPYLWTDGIRPRATDKLTWQAADVVDKDGTHPSDTGRKKVADLLMTFFKTDEGAKGWFLKAAK